MPAEGPGVTTELPSPGAPPKKMGGGRGARDPPASDSEKDSGFSDTSSEHRDRRERTDAEELPDAQPAPPQHPLGAPAAPGYHPFARLAPVYLVHNVLLQQPLGAPPEPWQPARLLLLQPPPPSASHQDTAVARHDATATVAPVGNPGYRSRRLGVTAELLRRGGLLAAALRTGALLRQNRRTQREIVALRRHTRLLARAACDPRVWPRLRDALGGGGPPVPPAPRQDPPAFGEGVGAGGL